MFCSVICIHMYGCIDRFTHVCIYSEVCACCANIDTDKMTHTNRRLTHVHVRGAASACCA